MNKSDVWGSATRLKSCTLCDWIFWIFLSFIYVFWTLLVTLCKKIRKFQETLGNQDTLNLEGIHKHSESHILFLNVADPSWMPDCISYILIRQHHKSNLEYIVNNQRLKLQPWRISAVIEVCTKNKRFTHWQLPSDYYHVIDIQTTYTGLETERVCHTFSWSNPCPLLSMIAHTFEVWLSYSWPVSLCL